MDILETSEGSASSETSEITPPTDTPDNSDGAASGEDVSDELEADTGKEISATALGQVRLFKVQATVPQDLTFRAPKGCVPGQTLCVQGPHGPLYVQAPPGVTAGRACTLRLAAPWHQEVFVPAGAKPGQKVQFLGPHDEQLEAVVPPGKKPGQVFQVSPPVVMLQVPPGAVAGDHLAFVTPDGKAMISLVPKDVLQGQYFASRY